MKDLIEILDKVQTSISLSEAETKDKNIIGKLKYCFCVADVENGNKRIYPAAVLSEAITGFSGRLAERNIAGQINHPQYGSVTELEKVSHVVVSASFDGSKGIAESAILNTSKGKDLKVLIQNNVALGASMRGKGQEGADGVIMAPFVLEAIDIVTNPSFKKDTMIDKKNLTEAEKAAGFTSDQIQEEKYHQAINAGFRGTLKSYVESLK